MFEPAIHDTEAYIGVRFNETYQFFTDDAETVVWDVSPYTFQYELDGMEPLTVGHGLTIDVPTASVTVVLTGAQTALRQPSSPRYRLKATSSVDDGYLLHGYLEFKRP